MWWSLALAGRLALHGELAYRAPDGVIHAEVSESGDVWTLSERGSLVRFDASGTRTYPPVQVCGERSLHTRFAMDPSGTLLAFDCGNDLEVVKVKGSTLSRRKHHLRPLAFTTHAGSVWAVGQPFEGDMTLAPQLFRLGLDADAVALEDADAVDILGTAIGLVLAERTWDEEDHFAGWQLRTVTEGTIGDPFGDPILLGQGDETPTLTSRGDVVCLALDESGACRRLDGTDVTFGSADLPRPGPDQGIPTCAPSGDPCFAIEATGFRPLQAKLGIGRIEAVASSADETEFLTRDHRGQVLHHSPQGRLPIARSTGRIGLSPSARFAWYDSDDRRIIRTRMIDGVRTTVAEATAAVFGDDDTLYLTVAQQGATVVMALPSGSDVPLPLVHVFDPREATDLQFAEVDERPSLLLEFADDEVVAVVDVDSRTLGLGPRSDRTPFQPHLFLPETPVTLHPRFGLVRAVKTDRRIEVRHGRTVLGHTELDGRVVFGAMGGFALYDDEGAIRIDSLYGERRLSHRIDEVDSPIHTVWVGHDTVYIAFRNGLFGRLR